MDIYQRVSGVGGCQRSSNTSELNPEVVAGKNSHQDDYKGSILKWLTPLQGVVLCDLLLRSLLLRPFLVCVLSVGGNENVKEPKWAQTASPQLMHHDEVCSGLCANSPRTHKPDDYYMIQPSGACVRACVWIFLVTGTHPQWSVFLTRCVRAASRWGASQMVLNAASPGALQTVPRTARRSRADLIVCTSECSPQHHCAASLHIIQSCNG